MDYYNQKRCVDGKGLVLPSQIVSLLCNGLIRSKFGDSGVVTGVLIFSGNDVFCEFWSNFLCFTVFFCRGMSNILNES